MGCIRQKLWDIFVKIYWIYWSIVYIKQKLRDVLGKMMGYTGPKLWDTLRDIICQKLWDISDKNYGSFWVKLLDILWNIIGNIYK